MKAVERAQASNPQFQVVLKESKDPTGPPAEHLQRTVPKDIKVVVGSDEDIVFFRLKNEPDIPIRKGTGRTVVGENPVFVNQCSRGRAHQQITVGAEANRLHRLLKRRGPERRVYHYKAKPVQPHQRRPRGEISRSAALYPEAPRPRFPQEKSNPGKPPPPPPMSLATGIRRGSAG